MSQSPLRNRLADPDLTNPWGWIAWLYAAIFSLHAFTAMWFSLIAIRDLFTGATRSTATIIGTIIPALTALAMGIMDLEATRLDDELINRQSGAEQ
jgi:hypothetical protein